MEKILKSTFLKTFNISIEDFNENISSKNLKKWDSLNHIKLIINLEKNLKKKVNPGKISSLNSFRKIKKFFLSKK
jgi:acyl carrier protein